RSRRFGHSVLIRARRHRQDEIDSVPGALSPTDTIGPPLSRQGPNFHSTFKAFAVLPLTGELAVAGDIGQVFLDSTQSTCAAGHLYHHFRPAPSNAPDLGARQAHPAARGPGLRLLRPYRRLKHECR